MVRCAALQQQQNVAADDYVAVHCALHLHFGNITLSRLHRFDQITISPCPSLPKLWLRAYLPLCGGGGRHGLRTRNRQFSARSPCLSWRA